MSRILIVDDEKGIRVTLREFLLGAGYSVEVAADAPTALDFLKSEPFDVVVSDIILPGVTGVELLDAIRHVGPHIQVVLMTGEPTVETASEAVRLGAFDYIVKPITKGIILRCVGNAARVKALDDEARRLAEANRNYSENLEAMVATRTAELERAMEDLRRAQQEMVKHERLSAFAQMAGGVAHDLNNALMPMVGLSEFLLREPGILKDADEAITIIREIHTAALDGRDIVRRLRQFYKPDEDSPKTRVKLGSLLRDVVELTKPRWREHASAEGVDISVELSLQDDPEFWCNETEIREMLINLIMNSVDAMPAGGRIVLKLATDTAGIRLEVADAGKGMSEDVARRCFEPFFTTKGHEGTGLGLAMVDGIVKRHRGTVAVDSVEGRGTTVTITMPALDDASAMGDRPPLPAPVRALRVMVVDDDPRSTRLFNRILDADGHKCRFFDNGRECVEAFCPGETDVLITDRAMPGMAGDELVKAIRQLDSVVAVIMVTGFGDSMRDDGVVPDGVDLVVSKPVTLDSMRVALAEVMNREGKKRV